MVVDRERRCRVGWSVEGLMGVGGDLNDDRVELDG